MLHMAYTLKNHFAHKPLTLIDAQEKEEEYKAFFSFIDKDGDGFISAAELLGFFKTTLDETFPVGAIEQMMGEADIDGDGKINYEEFVKQMTGTCSLPRIPTTVSRPRGNLLTCRLLSPLASQPRPPRPKRDHSRALSLCQQCEEGFGWV